LNQNLPGLKSKVRALACQAKNSFKNGKITIYCVSTTSDTLNIAYRWLIRGVE
jgi:hypothetical protein